MSAAEKELEDVRSLGIVAGGGSLPEKLLHACERKGIEVFLIGFEGQTDPMLVRDQNHMWTRLGAAGQMLSTLKAHEIKDLVLIGSIRRPSLAELKPDLRTAEFFAKIGLKALGDNDLLRVLRDLLEEEGFRIHGVHKFAEDLLAPEGVIGKHSPKKSDWPDIARGLDVAQQLGAADVGQSVIVQEGMVLAVEAVEGTDELIQRSKHLVRKGRKAILVKTCKPGQDRDLDLPTIGPETLKKAADSGLGGVVVHAGASLVVDIEKVAQIADKHKIFVIGVNPQDVLSQPTP